jgi:two-component system, cell cycle response regulator CtrA
MRLLLIEDDPTVAETIELMLRCEDIDVQTTELGQDGLDLGSVFLYDLILLDLNLPDMSGFDVLRSLRLGKIKTPVLILSGLNGIEQKVKGLGLGADDYLTKPFQSDELIARIRAILRRSGDQVESVIRCGDLTLKLDQKRAQMGRRDLGLTTKEYQMLELLAMRQGTPITKDMFLGHLYGGMDEPDQKIIDVFICKLRKKLMQASGGKDYIETIWGRGYVLRNPEPVRARSLMRAVGWLVETECSSMRASGG